MPFDRRVADSWWHEVPGARWYKADLHLHTIDDHAGNRAKLPAGIAGVPDSPETLKRYARCFLQGLAKHGVQVAGLTPHSPRTGAGPDTSAVWKIVEEWNEEDDDGIPFREKIYAVFPGFEPSFREGKQGLHLLFLFDPEIGRERYLRSFDLVTGGISAWKGGDLQVVNKRPEEAFDGLQKFQRQECPEGDGDYLVLAPHIDADKGLLGAQKAQVLAMFDHEKIAALELSDEKLPEDTLKDRSWLWEGMESHRQAFFHASDAYGLEDIGQRHTWIKLASPRIEALRQAFVARDSRVRLGFDRGEDGALRPIANPPDVILKERPWLREVEVGGDASFFGGSDGEGKTRQTRFQFSPDLTCIIGGSMTGKSTLLDGLRVHAGAPLPDHEVVRANVKARAISFPPVRRISNQTALAAIRRRHLETNGLRGSFLRTSCSVSPRRPARCRRFSPDWSLPRSRGSKSTPRGCETLIDGFPN